MTGGREAGYFLDAQRTEVTRMLARDEEVGGSAWNLWVSDLAVDTGGRVTVTGRYETGAPFDVGLLLPAGKHPEGSTFLAQYAPNGTPLWGYVYDLPLFASIVVDALGDIVLGSGFAESFDFGGGLLENLGYDDAILTKIRPE